MADAEEQADALAVARRIALTKLTARAHSVEELRGVLAKKNVPSEVAEELLGRFCAVGLLDDADFAEQWVTSRHATRHASRAVLRRELRGKGVADEVIEAALEPIDRDAEFEAALALAERKARTMRGLPRQVAERRLAGVLARRGFDAGLIVRIVSSVVADQLGGELVNEADYE